jgi:hypothetical protein
MVAPESKIAVRGFQMAPIGILGLVEDQVTFAICSIPSRLYHITAPIDCSGPIWDFGVCGGEA